MGAIVGSPFLLLPFFLGLLFRKAKKKNRGGTHKKGEANIALGGKKREEAKHNPHLYSG